MKLPDDIKQHLLWGCVFALFFALIAVGPRFLGGVGATLIVASVVAGWGLEKYQEIRGQGIRSAADWAATSAPGVFGGFLIGLAEAFL